MRLLQFPYSPFAAKIRTCLKVKELACEVQNLGYLDRKELVRLTGALYVPVLVDGALVVSDSAKIVAHLDTKPGAKLRTDPMSLVLEQWADDYFQEQVFRFACPKLEERMARDQGEEAMLWFRLVKERRYGAGVIAQWRAEEHKHLAEAIELLAPVVETLRQRPYLLGDRPSSADAAVVGQLYMLEQAMPDFVSRCVPGVETWYRKLKA